MGIADASRRRVEAVLDRIEAEYGPFEVIEKGVERDAETYAWVKGRHEAGTVGGAGAWVRNGTGEVLLVQQEPGGRGPNRAASTNRASRWRRPHCARPARKPGSKSTSGEW